MTKKPDPMIFLGAKEDVMENLDALQLRLDRTVDQGMVDLDDTYHNEILALMDDASLAETWFDLSEIISRAKTLEVDVDAWLSLHGYTTIDLQWPTPPTE